MAVTITVENFSAEVLKSDLPVLADFYSDTCQPCKRLMPILAELDEEYGGRLKICKVNVNGNQELFRQLNIMSVPTLLFFKEGLELRRTTNFIGKDTLREIIQTEVL